MKDRAQILEFSTRLVYSIEGLSDDLKVHWSRILSVIFSGTLPESQIQFNESKAATRRFRKEEELLSFVKTLEQEELVELLALIETLGDQAGILNDQLAAKRMRKLIDKVVKETNLAGGHTRISELHQVFQAQLRKFERRPVVKIPARIWPISFDFFLRWAALTIFNVAVIDKDYLFITNIIVLPAIILLIVFFQSRSDRKYNQQLLQVYGGSQRFKIASQISTSQYTALALFMSTGLFVGYMLMSDSDVPGLNSSFSLLGFILYYGAILKLFSVGRINESDLATQVAEADSKQTAWDADENDEAIINLETNLNSIASRLEAYVLESALFGALSFSGFLQIIANNIITFQDMDRFAQEARQTAFAFVNFDWSVFEVGLNGLGTDKSLFCLVSVETLVCSIFFLAVIASRLQFSDVADKVREAMNLAKSYNSKEEMLLDKEGLSQKDDERFRLLNLKISEQLEKVVRTTEELKPVMQYMQYFRNGGIIVFLVLLVNSSLFITGALAWAFTMLGLGTLLYFKRDEIGKTFRASYLRTRIQFISHGHWLVIISVTCLLLAYVFRIGLQWAHTEFFRFLFVFLFGLYGLTWIVFTPHFDPTFGDIESSAENKIKDNNWRIIKNFYGPVVLCIALAISMKILHRIGANALLMLSLLSMAILGYFLGYYLSKNKVLGIFAGLGIAVSCMGILFKVLHLSGGDEVNLFGFGFLTIFLIVALFKRRFFHKLLIQSFVITFFFNIYFSSGVFFRQSIYSLLSDVYTYKTFDLDEIGLMTDEVGKFREGRDSKARIVALNSSLEMNNRYIQKYGNKLGWTDAYAYMKAGFSETGLSILDSVTSKSKTFADSEKRMLVELGLDAARQATKIDSIFNFEYSFTPPNPELEADLLMTLGRKDEALQLLENVKKSNPPDRIMKSITNKIKELSVKQPS